MTDVDEMVAWFRACLDEDERDAHDVHNHMCSKFLDPGGDCTCGQPDRIRREVEAKRRIIDEHQRQPWYTPEAIARYAAESPAMAGLASCARCYTPRGDAQVDEDPHSPIDWPCPTLRLLALPLDDRPGYQESWRP